MNLFPSAMVKLPQNQIIHKNFKVIGIIVAFFAFLHFNILLFFSYLFINLHVYLFVF